MAWPGWLPLDVTRSCLWLDFINFVCLVWSKKRRVLTTTTSGTEGCRKIDTSLFTFRDLTSQTTDAATLSIWLPTLLRCKKWDYWLLYLVELFLGWWFFFCVVRELRQVRVNTEWILLGLRKVYLLLLCILINIYLCWRKLSWRLKYFPQISQENVTSGLLWVRSCIIKLYGLVKRRWQNLHTNSHFGRILRRKSDRRSSFSIRITANILADFFS